MKNETQRGIEQAVAPLVAHWTPLNWESSKTLGLGCAAASTGLVFLIAQIGVKSTALVLSLWFAAIALPLWLAFWQVCDTYSFWGRRATGHFNQIGWVLTCSITFGLGAVLLFMAIAALIWSLLPGAGAAFVALTLIAFAFAGWHSVQVKSFVAGPTSGQAENDPDRREERP